jgi:hypothetical protein
LFKPGDFFPTISFNPASDMLTGISRRQVGLSSGNNHQLFLAALRGIVPNKLLRPFVANERWRCKLSSSVLPLNTYFEINNYMVDLVDEKAAVARRHSPCASGRRR